MTTPQIHSSTDEAQIELLCSQHNNAFLPSDFHQLHAAASAAKATAYCPYSRFRVGAAVLAAAEGVIVPGANVENASYPVGTCAERVALGRAVTEGHREGIRALAVATDVSPPASPCGMCRQL